MCTRTFHWYQNQWPWATPAPSFKFQGHGKQNWRFSAFKPPISQKRLKLRSCNFHHTVALSL